MAPDIDVIQRYIAYGSVGASTVRGLRTKGVVDAVREALRDLNLKPYGDGTAKSFRKTLDADTEDVRSRVAFWCATLGRRPQSAKHLPSWVALQYLSDRPLWFSTVGCLL